MQRRDFLNGMMLTLGSGAGVAESAAASTVPDAVDPWAGQDARATSLGHRQGDGPARWAGAVAQRDPGLEDLVVVGSGLSGLAGALTFVRHAGRRVRVRFLDAQPVPGGHAQRNEFVSRSGRRLIGYGGSQALDSPGLFSPAVHELLRHVGIELDRFDREIHDGGWRERHGLDGSAVWFDGRAWTADRVVLRRPGESLVEWLARSPMSARARESIVALGRPLPRERWPAPTPAGIGAALAGMTYSRFLTQHWRAPPEVLRYFGAATLGYFGVGIDATSALDASTLGLPGFDGLALSEDDARLSPSARLLRQGTDDYVYQFPDGNAGVARALIRALRPDLLPGDSLGSLVDAPLPLDRLDDPDAQVRWRQRAMVVQLRHLGPPESADRVELRYLDEHGALHAVQARQVLLACWHRSIARMTDELPVMQRRLLDEQVKVPLVYATALLANWRAWQRAGIGSIRSPGGFWNEAGLVAPVRMGSQRPPEDPGDPILVHLGKVVVPGNGRSPREQSAEGRRALLAWPFERFEDETRRLLSAVLGPHGFDAARDLEALTVNRWGHGYAYEYARPWDRHWPSGALPHEQARRGWGRVAIANSDAGAYAYAHSAIDQAVRAVGELLPGAALPAVSREPGPYRPV